MVARRRSRHSHGLTPAALASVYLLFAACAFGSVSVLAKLAYAAGAAAAPLLAVRIVVAAGLLAVAALPALVRLRDGMGPHDLTVGSLAGAAFAAAGLLEFEALSRLPAATVVLLLFVAPAWVALASWVLWRTRLGWRRAGWIGLVLAGVGLLSARDGGSPAEGTGVLLALLGSVSAAVFFLAMERVVARTGPERAGGAVALGAITTVALLLPDLRLTDLDAATTLYGAATGGLTAAAVWLISKGMRGTSAVSASAIVAAEPLVAAVGSWVVLDERLGELQLVGAAGVLAGVSALSLCAARAPHTP